MLNVWRSGPSSISKILRVVGSTGRIISTRPSVLSLSSQSFTESSFVCTRLYHKQQSRDVAPTQSSADTSRHQHEHREVSKFQELLDHDMVHRNVVNQITGVMRHHTMTEVQCATINQALQGTDIIAQARTGTGKTLGFLVPTIQNILRKSPELATLKRYSRARASDIRAIIISPTRELAEQIAVEAQKLCYNTDLRVQVATGGNSKRMMLKKTQQEGCHLLVATPGRLNDLLEDKYSGVSAPGLTTLVLDEADRLLDEGFSKEVENILNLLPDRRDVDRQTLLFSATIPREVMHLVKRTLKPDFHFIQTVKEGEIATHDKVPQNIIVTPGIENWMPALIEIGKKSIAAAKIAKENGEEFKPFKAIVYFSATAQVELAYQIARELQTSEGGMLGRHPLAPAELYIINGKMSQEARTRSALRFRKCVSAILFSSDVTARGMDFPNVTHVIQIGLPPNREQYIHRIGRTGRGDNSGEGFIIIDQSLVKDARRMLQDLPITVNTSVEAAQVDMTNDAQLPKSVANTLSEVSQGTKMVGRNEKDAAYISSLNTARSPAACMALARWTKYGWGYEEPPPISPSLAKKLGISKYDGIVIGRREDSSDSSEYGFGALQRDKMSGSRDGYGSPRGGVYSRNGGGYGERRGGYARSRSFGGGDAPRQSRSEWESNRRGRGFRSGGDFSRDNNWDVN